MAKKKKKTQAQTKKKLEFSKIIFICTALLFTLVVIGSFALMWHVGDTSALICLISTTATMVTVNLTVYSQKSKAENLLKIRNEYNLTIQEAKSLMSSDSTSYEDTTYGEDM